MRLRLKVPSMPGTELPRRVPPVALTLLLCRYATLGDRGELLLGSAGVFGAKSADQLYLAGTYDGPVDDGEIKLRAFLVNASGKRVASVTPVERSVELADIEADAIVRLPIVFRLPPIPEDLEPNLYVWRVRLGRVSTRIPMLLLDDEHGIAAREFPLPRSSGE